MPTKVYTKDQFLQLLNTLEKDDVILATTDITGNLTVSTKKNEQKITFSYAADAFARPGDIGHWAFGKTPAWSFTICKAEDVSEGVKKLISEPIKPLQS
jgi:hypothetical protein